MHICTRCDIISAGNVVAVPKQYLRITEVFSYLRKEKMKEITVTLTKSEAYAIEAVVQAWRIENKNAGKKFPEKKVVCSVVDSAHEKLLNAMGEF